MFNMQSGLHRRTYAGTESKHFCAFIFVVLLLVFGIQIAVLISILLHYLEHTRAITGLASDPLNRILISGSLDGTIKVYRIIFCSYGRNDNEVVLICGKLLDMG